MLQNLKLTVFIVLVFVLSLVFAEVFIDISCESAVGTLSGSGSFYTTTSQCIEDKRLGIEYLSAFALVFIVMICIGLFHIKLTKVEKEKK